MAGDIFLKEGTLFTLESSGSALTTGTAVAGTTNFDARNAGSAGVIQNIEATFELVCQWSTVTGIVAGTVAAELYAVPAIDGTNFSDVDTTGSTSFISYPAYLGNFVCSKVPTGSTNMRFHSTPIRIRPFLYKPYILNRSGQTIASTWTLKIMTNRYQYT
jgi:hypothetical protein